MTELKDLIEAIKAVQQLKEIVEKHEKSLVEVRHELTMIRNQLKRAGVAGPAAS